MKKLIAIVLCFASLALLACSNKKEEPKAATWAGLTEVEIFQEIPAPADASEYRMVAQGDYGANNYVLELGGVMLDGYKGYIQLLKDNGYEVLYENAEGIDGAVFATTVRKPSEDGKGNITMAVSFAQTQMKMYLSATKSDVAISPYLTYNADDVAKNASDAKTTLTMQ